jgi:chromosome segregation ATPase
MADKNKEAQELKGILGEVNAALKEMEDRNKRIKDGFASSKDSLSGLVGLASEFNAHQNQTKQLSSDQLKNLSEKIQKEKENLKLSQESLAAQIKSTSAERDKASNQVKHLEALQKEKGFNKEREAQIKKLLNKSIEFTNTLVDQEAVFSQSQDILEDMDGDIKNLEKDLKKAVQAAKGFEILGKIGKSLDKINSPLDGMFNPLQLINKVIGFIVGTTKELDKELGDAAKSMNMTYKAAGQSRMEMTKFAEATGDTLVNSKHLQESVLSINESLGSNVAFEQMSESFQKDVAFLSKMSHFAGLTAEEANSIAKLTLATGQSAEKFTGELMGQVKLSGTQKGIMLNEKTALKEISKTSAAIKMSFHGSAKGLGDAYAKAKALGTSLDKVDDIAGSILNFEESIEAELSAELLTGKNLNLEKAREAALNNDIATVAEEIAKNVGSAAGFAEMNRIQQDAIAKSVGMTREELAASLQEQESLKAIGAASVEDARAKYDKLRETMSAEEALKELGDEQLAQQFEQQSIQENLGAAQLQMADSMNKTLIPALTTINENFNDMWNRIKAIIDKLGGMKTVLMVIGGIMALKMVKGIYDFASGVSQGIKAAKLLATEEKKGAIASIISGAWKALGPTPFIGAALATAAVGVGVGYLMSQMNDGIIGPSGGSGYGDRTLFGPEGAISFNNKDTIVAGTNLFKADDMVSAPKGAVQVGGGGSSREIADLKGAIMALASRPVNVSIDGKKVIEATTGSEPNTQGVESAKNSFKMQ